MAERPSKPEVLERVRMLTTELERVYPGRVHVVELLKSTIQLQINFPFDGDAEHERIMAEKARGREQQITDA